MHSTNVGQVSNRYCGQMAVREHAKIPWACHYLEVILHIHMTHIIDPVRGAWVSQRLHATLGYAWNITVWSIECCQLRINFIIQTRRK